MPDRFARAALALAVAGLFAAQVTPAAAEVEVIGRSAPWRMHVVFCQPHRGLDGEIPPRPATRDPWIGTSDGVVSPPAPDDWMQPTFDDAGWRRRPGPFFEKSVDAAVVSLRGRFEVTEPARAGLTLGVQYRGGLVVYVNGQEVARYHLPRGPLKPLQSAAPYPPAVFVMPNGGPVPEPGSRSYSADAAQRVAARIRKAAVKIPASVLVEGVNVVALRAYRAPLPRGLDPKDVKWDTAGIDLAMLVASSAAGVTPATPPAGEHLWIADPMAIVGEDASAGDPCEPLGPMRLAAPVKGLVHGQVVLTAPGGARGLQVRAAPMTGPGGRTIPATAVRIRYADVTKHWIPLFDEPVPGATLQPIWVTVRVPADAAPGTYTGGLAVAHAGRIDEVPIELTVYGWKVADPKGWRTWINFLQSPESVAGQYGVPLWSDRHFELMAPSMRLMGEAGNDVLGVSAVAKNVFGNDPLIVFRREGGRVRPELKFLRRYLETYAREAHEPAFLSVHVWNYGMYYRGFGRDGGDREQRAETIPVIEIQGDRLVEAEHPIFGRPGTEPLWQEVMDGVRDAVREVGWKETRVLLGTGGDTWPSPVTVAFFKKIAPWAEWRVLTHGCGAPRWAGGPTNREQPNGMIVGYLEIARRIRSGRPIVPGYPVTCNTRDRVGSRPFDLRSMPCLNTIQANFEGFCWKGIDYWPFTDDAGKERTVLNHYVRFGNMVGGTARALAWPGPAGAVPTVQYEMLRQGTQENDAMIVIRGACRDPAARGKLGRELVAEGEAIVAAINDMAEPGCRIGGGGDYDGLVRRLYEAAARFSSKLSW